MKSATNQQDPRRREYVRFSVSLHELEAIKRAAKAVHPTYTVSALCREALRRMGINEIEEE